MFWNSFELNKEDYNLKNAKLGKLKRYLIFLIQTGKYL
jgi:hypothetical protein